MEPIQSETNSTSSDTEHVNSSLSEQALTLLEQGCAELGVSLDAQQLSQFQLYLSELVAWNRKFNLTAITDSEEVQVKHFLDSLSSLPLLAEEVNDELPFLHSQRLVDVGTGAGFPGIPLKIAAPQLDLTLVDGTGKKVRFLEYLCQTLDLTQATVVQGRAEELGRRADYRAQFDIVTARAVAPLNTLVEYLLPWARIGGLVVVYKGGRASEEFIDARKAIQQLGGDTVRFAPVRVPFLQEKRFVLLLKKVAETPEMYPRGQGLPRKKPL